MQKRCLPVIDTMEALNFGDLTEIQASNRNYVGLILDTYLLYGSVMI
jgi:hypothetical protein